MNSTPSEDLLLFRNPFPIQNGQTLHLRFGPLDLFILKDDVELKIQWMTSNDWLDQSFSFESNFEGPLPENLLQSERFSFDKDLNSIQISPSLGERSFVAKPDTRLKILPGEKAKIFMSTPMSMTIKNPANNSVIAEIPAMDRAQTWFGENTTKGELCFFTRIYAALRESDLPFRPHRAMTHVHITNRSKKPIPITRLKIPVTYFSLFQKKNGKFVTSSLEVICDTKGQVRELKVRPPKTNIQQLTRISPPRKAQKNSMIVNSIQELLR